MAFKPASGWRVAAHPPQRASAVKRALGRGLVTLGCIALTACATAPAEQPASTGLLGRSLEALGLKAPEPPALPKEVADRLKASAPSSVPLRLHAGRQLNVAEDGRSLAVVIKVYRLKEVDAFLTAPYESFADAAVPGPGTAAKDKAREVVLTPGAKNEVMETWNRDTPYLGVVALFRAPASDRWRMAFDLREIGRAGITIGIHDCAMSVGAGQPVDGDRREQKRLTDVRCL